MKRVIAYIDGYNLYYGLLKGTPYKASPLAIGNISTLATKDKGGEKPSFVGCLLSVVLTEIFSALACVFAGILIT